MLAAAAGRLAGGAPPPSPPAAVPLVALHQNTQNRQNLLQLGQGPVLTTVVLSTVLSTVLVPPWTCEQRAAPVAVNQEQALPCTSSSGLPAQRGVWPVVVTPAVVTSAVVVVVTPAVVTPAVVVVVTPVLYLASGSSALVVVLRGEAHDSRVAASEAPWLQDQAP